MSLGSGIDTDALLRTSIDALSDNIAVLDGDGRILAVNRAWTSFALANGCSLQRCGVGANYIEVADAAAEQVPEAREVARALREILAGRRSEFSIEYACHSPDERRWFSMRATRSQQDGQAGVVVAHQNITARVLAEQARRTSEARFRAIFERAGSGIALLDRKARILEANDALCAMLGYEAGGLAGRSLPELAHPPQSGPSGDLQTLLDGDIDQFEEERNYTRRDGGLAWVQMVLTPIRDESGQVQYAVALFTDIGQRKRSETRLRLFESVVVHANDGVMITEAAPVEEPQILYVNDAFGRMTGYAPEEVVGRTPALLRGEGTDREALARIEKALRERRTAREELCSYRRDGSSFWVEYSIVPVLDAAGSVTHLAAILRDTTGRREAEKTAIALAREEAARAEAEAAMVRTEAILESITDAFVAVDGSCRFNYVNRVAEELFGIRNTELLGKPIGEHRILRALEKECEQTIRDRVPRVQERWIETLRGWFEIHVGPSDGGVSIYVRDITGRRQAQDARERLSSILDATPDLVATFDARGRALYVNNAGREMLGIPRTADPGTWTMTSFHPPDAAQRLLDEAIPAAIVEGQWRGESVICHASGRETPVSLVLLAHRDEHGEVVTFSAVMRDIAASKEAEERQRFLAEAGRGLVASLDTGTTLDNLADAAVPALGDACLVGLVEGNQISQLRSRHPDPAFTDRLQLLGNRPLVTGGEVGWYRAWRTGEPELVPVVSDAWLWAATEDEEIYRLVREAGVRSLMMVPLVARGHTLGILAVGRIGPDRRYQPADLALAEGIAGRAAIAIDNARLYEDSQQASRLRDEVLGIVSHDLRSPLAAILVGAELILRGGGEEEVRQKQAQLVRRSARRALRLIEDLLDVAQIEGGGLKLQLAKQGPARLVEEALEAHRGMAQESEIELHTAVAPGLPEVGADHERIAQVFANLIGNALKYTGAGGRVRIAAEPDGSQGVRFLVEDTGPGIPREQQERIFDRFWQAKAGRRAGAGLGLAISRGIVEAHRGRIGVESDPGHGTTFWFTLPLAG